MRLELAERLVCPAAHLRTPLIVVAQEARDRDLLRATVGCMTCHREGTIAGGDLRLGGGAPDAPPVALAAADDASLDRLEALLGLAEPGAPVLLAARYAPAAAALALRTDAVVAVLGASVGTVPGVGAVFVAEPAVPFSDQTFAALTLDAAMPAAQRDDALRCLRIGGRVVAPVDVPVPAGVRELARDATEWVGEREAAAVVVPLRRA